MTEIEPTNCEVCPIYNSLRHESRGYDVREDELIIDLAKDDIGEVAESLAQELIGSSFHATLSHEEVDPAQTIARYLRHRGDELLKDIRTRNEEVRAKLGEISIGCPGPLAVRLIDDANDTAYTIAICRSPTRRPDSRLKFEAAYVRRVQIE